MTDHAPEPMRPREPPLMSEENSYRKILRSSTTIGGASFANVLIGLIRVKAIAALLGPSGIGVLGLLTTIMTTGATFAGAGMADSGVRQLAGSNDDPRTLARVRHALWIANLALGLFGGAALWMMRTAVSTWVFNDASRSGEIGWLGIGVMLSLIAASQTALLQGLRRIGELARASVLGALLSTVVGILVVWKFQASGLVFSVILGPAMSVLATLLYTARLPRPATAARGLSDLFPEWRTMLALGVVFMSTTLMSGAAQLLVRAIVTRDLGLEEAGYFQAAWVVSMQYIGFVLAAMAVDYYPRLVQVIGDREKVGVMVNQQAEIALLLAGPVILATIALAPWLIDLLYTSQFRHSVGILRWQVLGDVLKIAGWPMGFILIARAERRWFLLTQTLWNGGYALLVWLGLPVFGLATTGMAFFACYLVGFVVNLAVTRRVAEFGYSSENMKLLAGLLLGAIAIMALSHFGELFPAIVGSTFAAAFAAYALMRLLRLSSHETSLPRPLQSLFSTIGRWSRR